MPNLSLFSEICCSLPAAQFNILHAFTFWQLNRFAFCSLTYECHLCFVFFFMNTLRWAWMNNVVRFVLFATVKYAMPDMLLSILSDISIKIKSESKWKRQAVGGGGEGNLVTWQRRQLAIYAGPVTSLPHSTFTLSPCLSLSLAVAVRWKNLNCNCEMWNRISDFGVVAGKH